MKIVGCGFTLSDLVFQRISVVTSCMGESMDTDVATVGFGGSVPSSCYEEEVSVFSRIRVHSNLFFCLEFGRLNGPVVPS